MSTWRDRYQIHPAAAAFPMLDDAELEALGADIKANGLKVPIVFWRAGDEQFLLVDGRNRFEAMERAGIELPLDRFGLPDKYRGACVCKVSSRKDPLPLIIALNVRRRHLTKEQRAIMLAAEYFANACEVSVGGRGKADEAKAKLVAKASEQGVGKRTVENAISEIKARNRAAQEPHEKPSAAPNAPKEHWVEAKRLEREEKKRQRRDEAKAMSRAAKLSRMAPNTIDGWRRGYLNAVRHLCTDVDAEMQLVVDGLHEIAGEHLAKRRTAP